MRLVAINLPLWGVYLGYLFDCYWFNFVHEGLLCLLPITHIEALIGSFYVLSFICLVFYCMVVCGGFSCLFWFIWTFDSLWLT